MTARRTPAPADENLFVALRRGFPADLDSAAIEAVHAGRASLVYTWRDLERATAMFANLLDALDLPAGARIAVQVEKSVESLLFYLAVLRAGCVYLPLNDAYRSDEVAYFLADAEPALFVCAPQSFARVSKLAFAAGCRFVFTLGADRSGSLLERASHFADRHVPAVRAAGDLAAIVYTSGTTGRSKGAMLSHGNLLSNALTLKRAWGWQDRADVLIHALPIFHVHGLFVACHAALLAGARMLWLDRFDARKVIELLPRASVFMGVPTLYVRLLAEPGLSPAACRSMRLFISGSAPLLQGTFEQFRARSGHTILERYGMSETVMLTSNPYRAEDGERRGGTVGLPLPGVELRITGPAGAALRAGAVGAIEVRGPNVFAGYWRQPEKTREEFTADGWFRTGDVGVQDERGYLRIVGRSKDLIISGGYNVYPAEVESVLNALPGVAESAVVGVPHADFGEAVVAAVVARAGSELDVTAMTSALKKRIAGFKVPKAFIVVDELPRNAMGKVQKNVLRERHRALFA